MQVQKISFTSAQEQPQKESALYSKKGYMDLVRAGQFTEGFLAGYGVLETIDKFQLIKNSENLSAKALKQKAWKHTKYNLLAGIGTGIASVLIGKFITNKYLLPINEKLADYADRQQRINQKAKELVAEEENAAKEPIKPVQEEIKNEIKPEKEEIKSGHKNDIK